MANLTDDQAQKLRVGLMSAAWREIMEPATKSRAQSALNALCMTDERRKSHGGEFKDYNDADLKVTVRECEWHLSIWGDSLKLYDFNRAQDAQRSNGDVLQPAGTEDPYQR